MSVKLNEELEKQLADYWAVTAEERKRTHTGEMYKKHLKKIMETIKK